MIDWFVQTLRSYPEIAIFLSLALGYFFGSFTYKGLGLGAVTATLIAAVLIGQLGITVSGPLKPFFFLMFLFAIGYGVGPQFVRGIAKDGVPQAAFAAVVCVFCLLAAYVGARLAGYDVGSAVGLYAGSQTISASMGLATDAINRLGLPPDETKKLLDGMPVAYAVTYIFGTVGSAIVLALFGPALLGIDLEAHASALRRSMAARRSWVDLAPPGISSNCVHSASPKGERLSGGPCRKPRRCFPNTGCSSCASAVMERSSMPRRMPSSTLGMWCRWLAVATCW